MDEDRDNKGKFKKGHKGYKPKGAISEKTAIWEEIGDWFKEDGLGLYTEALSEMLESSNKISKLEGMKRYEALLEYFKPKLSRTDSSIKHEGSVPITINKTYDKE